MFSDNNHFRKVIVVIYDVIMFVKTAEWVFVAWVYIEERTGFIILTKYNTEQSLLNIKQY